jgi:tetrapyrrole methylase family protein/MazG family protein/ATP diphosphatase
MSADRAVPAAPESDHGFRRLVDLMDMLRDPGGCPWDAAQTLDTLKPYLIEEAYEVLEAMDEDPQEHCVELGDLLLQVVFQSRLQREEGHFAIDDVIAAICDKLVRRHPHVFADATAGTAEEALANWEQQKASEGKVGGSLGGVPKQLPALLRAQRTSEKAAALGFDWADHHGVVDKVREELAEVEEAAAEQPERAADEIGDLLFAVVNLARHLSVDAEEALRKASDKFVGRFRAMERHVKEGGVTVAEADMETLNAAWEVAKADEAA